MQSAGKGQHVCKMTSFISPLERNESKKKMLNARMLYRESKYLEKELALHLH